MSDNKYDDLDECIRQARDQQMTVYKYGDAGYDKSAEVYNARIHTKPAVVAYCEKPEHIAFWFRCAEKHGYPIQVRSGGHHHEGMCVETGAITLDMEKFNQISPSDEGRYVDLGPSAQLDQVVKALAAKGKIMPVGGCGTVCVGGLTHGGGWGASYRNLGLMIDKLREVDIMIPNGDMLTLDKSGIVSGETSIDFKDNGACLFRAIRGGGGGNFGVVTRFRFELTDMPLEAWNITMQWSRKDRGAITKEWAKLNCSPDHSMTTFCRLTVVDSRTHDFNNPAVIVGGRYYGSEADCRAALQPLVDTAKPELFQLTPVRDPRSAFLLSGAMKIHAPDGTPLSPQGYALNVGGARVETCLSKREPHKVTCVFPEGDGEAALSRIDEVLEGSKEHDGNAYVSLHGMGGQGSEEPPGGTSFSWRHKKFMIQVQAWWSSHAELEGIYTAWVEKFRHALIGVSSGSFINFPNRAVPVKSYYSEEIFEDLKTVKRLCDPGNVMRFQLSIPLE